jgi:hypothetical protein
VRGDTGIEFRTVLKGAVHALPKEGHDGVRRVTEQ